MKIRGPDSAVIDTHPSVTYFRSEGEKNKLYFETLAAWAGLSPHVVASNAALQLRIHQGAASRFLWVLNPTRQKQTATLSSEIFSTLGRVLWGDGDAVDGDRITVPPRDALVVALD